LNPCQSRLGKLFKTGAPFRMNIQARFDLKCTITAATPF